MRGREGIERQATSELSVTHERANALMDDVLKGVTNAEGP